MKIILICNNNNKRIIDSYLVDDDVCLPAKTQADLLNLGYSPTILHPIPTTHESLLDMMKDYLDPDKYINNFLQTAEENKKEEERGNGNQ